MQHLLGCWDTSRQVCVRGKTTLQKNFWNRKIKHLTMTLTKHFMYGSAVVIYFTICFSKLHQSSYMDWQTVGMEWVFNHHPEIHKSIYTTWSCSICILILHHSKFSLCVVQIIWFDFFTTMMFQKDMNCRLFCDIAVYAVGMIDLGLTLPVKLYNKFLHYVQNNLSNLTRSE